MHGSAPLAGKSGVSDVTDAFEGIFELLATLRVRRACPTRPLGFKPFWLAHAQFCAFCR